MSSYYITIDFLKFRALLTAERYLYNREVRVLSKLFPAVNLV